MSRVRCQLVVHESGLTVGARYWKLDRSPMVRLFFVIQVPDASDERGMSLTFCPIDSFTLRLKGSEHAVIIIFNNIIVDRASLRATLGTRFNIDIRHAFISLTFISEYISFGVTTENEKYRASLLKRNACRIREAAAKFIPVLAFTGEHLEVPDTPNWKPLLRRLGPQHCGAFM